MQSTKAASCELTEGTKVTTASYKMWRWNLKIIEKCRITASFFRETLEPFRRRHTISLNQDEREWVIGKGIGSY